LSETNITYSDAVSMDIEEIKEANAALDVKLEEQKKSLKRAKRGRGRRR